MNGFGKDIVLIIVTAIVTLVLPKIIKKAKTFLPGRGKLKRTIEKGINREIQALVEETCGVNVIRYGLKVEWDEDVDSATYLTKEGDVVVKLSYSRDKNQSRSFAKVLMLYLEESFMPEAKPFIGSIVHDGCKHIVAKEITFRRDTEAYRHYLAMYLSPLLSEGRSFEQLMKRLELISHRGHFRSVLLRELFFLFGSGILPSSEMRDEVGRFIDYLWDIANKREYEREHREEPPLSFINRYIKIQIVLVKRRKTEDLLGHIRACEIAFSRGAKTVYVAGWGEENKAETEKAAEKLVKKGFNLIKKLTFDAEFPEEVKAGICFVFGR